MVSIKYIKSSNGTGEAVRPTVSKVRAVGTTELLVSSVTNFPANFIATTGVLLSTGFLDPATITVFKASLVDGNILINEFMPGYSDIGNAVGDVLLIKPTSAWADEVANALAVAHNDDGTLKTSIIDSIKTDVFTGVATLTNKRINPRIYSTASTSTLAPNLSNYNIYTVTALATNITISTPTGTPVNGEVIVIRIKDNGTTKTITWGSGFVGIGDTLLANTTAGKWHYVNGMYNSSTSKWDMLPAIIGT